LDHVEGQHRKELSDVANSIPLPQHVIQDFAKAFAPPLCGRRKIEVHEVEAGIVRASVAFNG
jgi:hypothetical protein